MKGVYFIFLIVIVAILPSACDNGLDKQVDACLQFAGNNKEELEKILKHYETCPKKLQAAQFLLASMPYYYTYTGWEIDSLKQVLKLAIPFNGFIVKEIKERWKEVNFSRDSKKYDAHVVTAELLIENIDLAFEVWNSRSWSKFYSFDEFCEYILPYRIENEPLEAWRRVYYERYAPVLDSLYQGSDVVEAAKAIVSYLKEEKFATNKDFDLPHLGASFLLENRVGYCRENCDIATYVLRALGIPVTTDFYESSPTYQSKHYWNALIDTTKQPLAFNYIEEEISRSYNSRRTKGKVYRRYFCVQPEKFEGVYSSRAIPILFSNPFLKDVSVDYFGNNCVVIQAGEDVGERFMYLAVWDGREYEAIDIAEVKKNSYEFRGLEQELVYQPVIGNRKEMTPIYYPFLLKKSVPHFFIPDTSCCVTETVRRKYPVRGKIREYMNHIKGATLEADNNLNFKHPLFIHQIVDTPIVNYNRVVFDKPINCRYIRFKALKKRRIQLAELGFYTDTLAMNRIYPVKITPDSTLDKVQMERIGWTVDDDWVSHFYSERRGEILTYDLGNSKPIRSLVYIPRNDDNFVRAGDIYELFYQNGVKGWVSLGKQKSTTHFLVYNNIPNNALLWLRNHTRGKEERPFYYENGKQVFP